MNWFRPAFSPLRSFAWTQIKSWVRRSFPSVPTLSTAQLAETLQTQTQPCLLIDTRSAAEYALSHLPSAVHAQTVEAVETTLLHGKKNAQDRAISLSPTSLSPIPLILYCSIGYRSARLGAALQQKGYTVQNVEGSIFQWANEGRPLVSSGQSTQEVHPYSWLWGLLLEA